MMERRGSEAMDDRVEDPQQRAADPFDREATMTKATWRLMIDAEIADHKNWCGNRCPAFIPSAYREARERYPKDVVRKNYDLCHIWR